LESNLKYLIKFLNLINASLVDIGVLKNIFEAGNSSLIMAKVFSENKPLVFGIIRNFESNIKDEIFVRIFICILNKTKIIHFLKIE
jgi:hypothetical protein